MSRSKRFIEIEGILARDVLGTFTIIRGFATLQELAEMSAPHFMRAVLEIMANAARGAI